MLEHCEGQSDEAAAAEDEASVEATTGILTEVPVDLVPTVRRLIEQHKRSARDMTQLQVAAASGLHQSVVSRIEQRAANPTARTPSVKAIARGGRGSVTAETATE